MKKNEMLFYWMDGSNQILQKYSKKSQIKMSKSFQAEIKKSILKIMRENLGGDILKMSKIEIDLNIKKNASAIRMCIDEYIGEFGEEEEEVDEEWLEEYIAEYFE